MRALAVACLLVPASAAADVLQQPNGASIPSPMGCDGGQPTGLAAAFACACIPDGACNIGSPCPAPGQCEVPTGTCETTLWHEFNDNTCIPSNLGGLDPWRDGALEPETFEPTCPLTFTLITRGTARFRDVFGWYNATGARPADDALYPMLDCDAGPGTEVTLDVRSDPRWTGGPIGFFIATPEDHGAGGQCAGGDCCARVDRLGAGVGRVYYSERAFNPDAAGADSFIHLVIYDSVIAERAFYFAWEDIYGGSNNDFTDIVTRVGGVECVGGGAACDTGEPGLCAYGVTACRAGSALQRAGAGPGGEAAPGAPGASWSIECVQVYDATDEVCDGADNDCDGTIDEDVCSDDVVGNCEGVTCPEGEVCRMGTCTDPCEHVQCAAGEACLSGVCLAGCNQCSGVVCPDTKTCDLDSGACVGPDDGGGPDAGDGDGDGGMPGASGCCDTRSGGGGALVLALIVLVSVLSLRDRSDPSGAATPPA